MATENNTTTPAQEEQELTPSFKPSIAERLAITTFKQINKVTPWYKLPGLVGALNLAVLRIELRQFNLYDGYASGAAQGNSINEPLTDKRFLGARHSDGKFNSLEMPRMGCTGMRFGHNFPRHLTEKPTEEELMTPNPRLISNEFMTRHEFIPAKTLNMLAAAWIQFQTHDWFNHEESSQLVDISLPKGDDWPHKNMQLHRTKPDKVLDPSDVKTPGYKNSNTAWWDGSQIYGSTEAVTQRLRSKNPDGKLTMEKVGRETFLPRDPDRNVRTGFNTNWWVGMEMLHTLFALEHNAICDKLKEAHPDWTGDQIFDKARLVNCALMAKIHTIEWTPAILAHPALKIGMNANWFGLAGERLTKAAAKIAPMNEIIRGIPGSGVDQDGVPYSLTEEFVSVYRMHSLMPDEIAFHSATTGAHLSTIPMPSMLFTGARTPFEPTHTPNNPNHPITFADAFYSFGTANPGAITTNNYPAFMRALTTPDGQTRDLGTIDILRDRERGVPRYCAFRRLLRLSVPTTFLELTDGDEALAARLSKAYNGKIELVDALVGSHAEKVIPGFGFSETAFRVFILMASRRLKSDRFIAGAWGEEMYTKEGFKWVEEGGMKEVLGRHFPELRAVMGDGNAFAPWVGVGK
ncbi:heme peroxidase [Bombardia bombarda]|uniref:Heme peroxidase n=1 Tax=Bombardia bombarda TaxID=252184 RepID=A0AA39XBP2_9PEZI|nr:heme peroxidase [Bombardia bombarda]